MERTIAVTGAGYWGKNLIRNFAELGALHTVCDSNTASLRALSGLDGVTLASEFRQVLDNPAIAGVVLATPAQTHYSMARDALRAGKDVFVEKPLALTVREGLDLVNVAEKAGRVLMVGHLLDYHPRSASFATCAER